MFLSLFLPFPFLSLPKSWGGEAFVGTKCNYMWTKVIIFIVNVAVF